MKDFKKFFPFVFGALAGAVLGFLYYRFVGCNGSCMIASSPLISTLYGSVMGVLTVNVFRHPKEKQEIS